MAFNWEQLGMNAVNTLLGAGSSYFQSKLNERAIKQQNKYNMQMAKYQNAYNTEMWEKQNAYNSPEQTMQRLIDAGINPRAYQQIGQFANADAPSQAAEVTKVAEMSAYQNVVRQSLENSMLRLELKAKKKEIDETQSKIDYNSALTTLTSEKVLLTSRQSDTEYNKGYLTMFQALAFAGKNGIDPTAWDFGNYNGDNVFERQSLYKIIEKFDERYNADLSATQFIVQLRKFESLTKEQRYRVLEKYGLDTDGDSWLGLARWFLRIFDIEK